MKSIEINNIYSYHCVLYEFRLIPAILSQSSKLGFQQLCGCLKERTTVEESPRMPDPKLVHNLYRRNLKSQIVRISLLLDIFLPLHDGPATTEDVAKACNCDTTGTALLLDYLCSLGLILKRENTYSLTPTAATFFVSTQPGYVGNWVLKQLDPDVFQQMANTLRSGVPFNPDISWEESAWLESYDLSRKKESLEMWHAAGIDPEMSQGLNVLDLACGCGVTSFSLAQLDKTARVTCIDNEKVLKVAEDLATRLNLSSQVTWLAGDLHVTQFEEASYDVALLGNATNFFTPQQNIDLFQRIYRSLRPNGKLIINVTMESSEINEHTNLYSLILWTMSGTFFYPFPEYEIWLYQAGFRQVKQLTKLWLSAIK